jgi:hypothetical protein
VRCADVGIDEGIGMVHWHGPALTVAVQGTVSSGPGLEGRGAFTTSSTAWRAQGGGGGHGGGLPQARRMVAVAAGARWDHVSSAAVGSLAP